MRLLLSELRSSALSLLPIFSENRFWAVFFFWGQSNRNFPRARYTLGTIRDNKISMKKRNKTNVSTSAGALPTRISLALDSGFTLIELLVVIAVIAVLSAIVLAALNSARVRSNDAAVKSNLDGIRPQAEALYDRDNNYDAVCGANSVTQDTTIHSAIAAANSSSGATAVCGMPSSGDALAWAVSSRLKSSGYWCVDSTGTAKSESSAIAATDTVCP